MFKKLLSTIVFAATLGLCFQQPVNRSPVQTDKRNLLTYYDDAHRACPVRTEADWQIRRAQIIANMLLVMGPLPKPSTLPLDVKVEKTTDMSNFRREKITFQGADSDRVPAYLFIPKLRSRRKVAGILCLHETTPVGMGSPAGLGGRPNRHYALELAERGFVTLAPDYPNFAEYHFD